MKLYFAARDSEICYPLQYHIETARDNDLNEIELFEANHVKIESYGFCRAFDAVIEKGDCGKSCPNYTPRNGRFGVCKFRSNNFYEPGKSVKFIVNQYDTPPTKPKA